MRKWLFACALPLCATSLLYAQAAAPAKPAPAATPQPPSAAKQAPDAAAQSKSLPSPRSIVDKYVQAIGGRKAIMAHSSSHATGTMTVAGAGITGTIDIYNAKPNKSLSKVTISGIGEILEGFDGTRGWGISPMTGPSLAEGAELEQKRFDADFYSDLHDDARYTSMTTLEKTQFEGRPAYKVSFVKKIGGEDIEYFDAETGFKIGTTATREGPMGAMNITVLQSDYKKFGDVMVPTTITQKVSGVQNVITITSMEFDNVPAATFEVPDKIKALIK
jgi:zinc protease